MGDSFNGKKSQSGLNLIVKNLDEEINTEKLRKEFATFGAVKSVKVVSKNGHSKGFGFVGYIHQKDASRALLEMNGATLGSKKVAVMIASSKESKQSISPIITAALDSRFPNESFVDALQGKIEVISSSQPNTTSLKSTISKHCSYDNSILSRAKIVGLIEVQSESAKTRKNGQLSHSFLESNSVSCLTSNSEILSVLEKEAKGNTGEMLLAPNLEKCEAEVKELNSAELDRQNKSSRKKSLHVENKKQKGKNEEIANSEVSSGSPKTSKQIPAVNLKQPQGTALPSSSSSVISSSGTSKSFQVSPRVSNTKTSPIHPVKKAPATPTPPYSPPRFHTHPNFNIPFGPNQAAGEGPLSPARALIVENCPGCTVHYQTISVSQYRPPTNLGPIPMPIEGPKFRQPFTTFHPTQPYQQMIQFQPGPRFQPLVTLPPQYPILVTFPPLPQPMPGFFAPIQPPNNWHNLYSPSNGFMPPFIGGPGCSSPVPCQCTSQPMTQLISGLHVPPPLMGQHEAPPNQFGPSTNRQEPEAKENATICDTNSHLDCVMRKLDNFQHPNFNFTPTARNLSKAVVLETPRNKTPTFEATLHIQGQEPLTASMLASAKPEEQKQMLGERLLPLIRELNPDLADKITNMLLEMDNSEIVHMLDHQEYLKEMSVYADEVIKSHQDQNDRMSNDILSSIEKLVC